MNIVLLAGVLLARTRLRSHDRWSRETLLGHQARSLNDLRRYAVARSPFYRELHAGLEDAPLEALPVVSKRVIMERFDDVVTDREVRLKDVEAYLDQASATDRFRGRYRVAATGGTTGRRGVFLSDPTEWRKVLASYSRAYDWAGISAGLTSRLRMAVVSSRNPSHQSAIVGATVASRFVPTLRLDATQPLEDLVRDLNAFQPDALVGYASILRTLGEEQRAGRLAIRPRGVMSASEVLTAEMRGHLRSAFDVEPTNVYGATETAGIASECRHGRLHRYEDLVIAEIVDQDNRPVAPGEYGAKLLVTVLFSRTLPLIRYEMSDRVQALGDACPDGLPYALVGGVEGREEEVLTLAGVTVHPNVLHRALERLDVGGWQVIDEGARLRVLLARPAPGVDLAAIERSVVSALEGVGVRGIDIDAQAVDSIPRTALGKAPLIRRAGRALAAEAAE
jgi:phenylacetate-coenzyme A ligase PaaK-like adenylate-forming protein